MTTRKHTNQGVKPMAIVMTHDRQKIEIDSDWIRDNSERLGYVQAADGVWVPSCDWQQYVDGRRPFREQDAA